MKRTKTLFLTLALLGLSLSGALAQNYEILYVTGRGYNAGGNGGSSGFVASPQAAIDWIKTDAAGKACTIQFGNGTNTLDLGGGGSTLITFDGGASGNDWGAITLTGKATTAGNNSAGIIRLENKVSVNCKAELTATANGILIYCLSASSILTVSAGGILTAAGTDFSSRAVSPGEGTLSVNGGTVRATGANASAIYIGNDKAVVNIISGTVSATAGYAVYNYYAGTINISGGTVDGGNSYAIYNNSTGKITVSGSGLVTSANGNITQGTICLAGSATATAERLVITGGTVKNTAANGVAIRNSTTGAVNMSGGTVEATANIAIQNDNNATLNISGGTVRATTGNAVWNGGTGTITVSGTAQLSATGTNTTLVNNSTGVINISGGTVQATASYAVRNVSDGTVNISGGTVLATTGNAVRNANVGTVNISGGTVSATINYAVWNVSGGTVTISGGMVLATTGNAVWNQSTGTVTVSGGILFAYGKVLTDVVRGSYNYNNSTSSGIIAAWDKDAGKVNYTTGASEHIFKFPDAATAVWAKQGGNNGISVSYKTNSGFIPLGVTLADAPSLSGTVSITGTAAFGGTLTANTSGLTPTPLGTLSYQWKRGSTNIGSNSATYTLTQADIGSTITVTVSSSNHSGSRTSAPTATVVKATQTPPAAPTMASRTATSITLNAITGCEYRIGTGAWQTSTTFDGLTQNTEYRFTARRAETATHSASSASAEARFTTDTGTGIEELKMENGELKIYPNPTSGQLTIDNGELTINSVAIYNIMGKTLNNFQFSTFNSQLTIDVSHLASGIYYLRAGDKTVKFVKK